jgi:hypothetical protein
MSVGEWVEIIGGALFAGSLLFVTVKILLPPEWGGFNG